MQRQCVQCPAVAADLLWVTFVAHVSPCTATCFPDQQDWQCCCSYWPCEAPQLAQPGICIGCTVCVTYAAAAVVNTSVTELQALVQEAEAQRHDSRLVLGTCSAASRARFGRGRFAVCSAVVCVDCTHNKLLLTV